MLSTQETTTALLLMSLGICGCQGSTSAPPAPTSLSAVGHDESVILSWSDVQGADRYVVTLANYQGVTPDNYRELPNGARVDAGVASPFRVPGLTNGATYFFVVTAVRHGAESLPSPEAWGTPSAWGDGIPLESAEGGASTPALGADDAGNLHLLWTRESGLDGPLEIHAARWTAQTSALSAVTILDTEGTAAPSIAIRPDGTGLAAWLKDTPAGNVVRVSSLDTISGWQEPYVVTTTAGRFDAPSIVLPGNDAVLAWASDFVYGTSGTVVARVAADGGSFGPQVRLDASADPASVPVLAASGSVAIAAWIQGGQIWTNEWNGQWQGATAILSSGSGPQLLQLEANAAGTFVLGFVAETDANAVRALVHDPLLGWSAVQEIAPGLEDSWPPSPPAFAACNDGAIVAMFQTDTPYGRTVSASRRDLAGNWSAPSAVGESGGENHAPNVVVDSGCNAFATWTRMFFPVGGPIPSVSVNSSVDLFDDRQGWVGNYAPAGRSEQQYLHSSRLIAGPDDQIHVTFLGVAGGEVTTEIVVNTRRD